jgi:hypothetical protein
MIVLLICKNECNKFALCKITILLMAQFKFEGFLILAIHALAEISSQI